MIKNIIFIIIAAVIAVPSWQVGTIMLEKKKVSYMIQEQANTIKKYDNEFSFEVISTDDKYSVYRKILNAPETYSEFDKLVLILLHADLFLLQGESPMLPLEELAWDISLGFLPYSVLLFLGW